MNLPDIKDYVRLSPPWASVVPSRAPVVKWHATKGAARVSAMSNTMRTEVPNGGNPWGSEWVASEPFGVAVVTPGGNLAYVEEYAVGDGAGKYRDR